MLYVAIDIETTGLDTENNDILSIGAIIEDTNKKLPYEDLPKFHVAVLHESISGSPFAINMNKDLIEWISLYQSEKDQLIKNSISDKSGFQFFKKDEVAMEFFRFLYRNGIRDFDPKDLSLTREIIDGISYPMFGSNIKPAHITAAGKNFGTFDKIFLEKLPKWQKCIKIRQRIIDPSILFTDWKNDDSLPSLLTCKERSGVKGKVSHNALEDSWDIIQILRKTY